MTDPQRENLVAESLSDVHDRLTRGEDPSLAAYSDVLGDAFSDLLDVVEVEREIRAVLDPQTEVPLPREFGPYTLLRELGRGAVGIVYEAEHRDLGRRQAVKVLRAGFEDSGDPLERFRREAKALASIDHPHIVEIYDAGEIDGRAYYAMALVEGRTLSRLLKEEGPPDPRWVCRELAGVADALHALHEAGTFHRDVKPSNIMIDADGRMVLADFGLARAVGSASLTRSGQALGTPLYMSPEQMLGKNDDVDGRSDVYGLGATLYEMLTGRKVFDATDVRALLHRVLHEQPTDARRLRPELPEGCGRIARKALEKQRADRYASAAAMRDDLTAFAEGRPVLGRPVSRLRHFARRHRGGLAAAAAALVVALGIGLWKHHEHRQALREPGTLQLVSLPRATVEIDGVPLGEAPQVVRRAPGEYEVVFARERFRRAATTVHVAPGREEPVKAVLKPLDPTDTEALAILAEEVLALESEFTLTPAVRHRGTADQHSALLPAGRVRPEDLDRYYLLLDYDAPLEGYLVFWKLREGETILLHREPLSAEELLTTGPVPPAVREKVRSGDVVRWGYVDERGRGPTAEFEVVTLSDADAERVATIRAETASFEPVTRAWLEARFLLDRKLYVPAYLTLRPLALDPTRSAEARLLPWAVMSEALREAGMGGSPWADEADTMTLAFPADERKAVYGTED